MAGYTKAEIISIHALLAESDAVTTVVVGPSRDFYPRSPCGERRRTKTVLAEIGNFYPRSPCGERRHRTYQINAKREFLSTLSLRRATTPPSPPKTSVLYFYPRTPCGERHRIPLITLPETLFLSTLSLRRATKKPLIS